MKLHTKHHAGVTTVAFLLIIAAAWASLNVARIQAPDCVTAHQHSDAVCTAEAIIRRDPYCILDPTCISPFYVNGVTPLPNWQGQKSALRDPTLGGHTSYRAFGLANWFAFNLVAATMLLATIRFQPTTMYTLQLGIVAWYALEWLRWTWVTYLMTERYSWVEYGASAWTYIGLAATLLPLLLIVWYLRHHGLARRCTDALDADTMRSTTL